MENTYRVGHFVWRELMTTDVQKARGFYGELFGWSFNEMPIPGGVYTVVKKGEQQLGGMMKVPDAAVPSAWMSYVSLPNVDEAVKTATELGGTAMLAPMDMPGVGRFAIIKDSTGGVIGLLRNATTDGPATMPPPAGTFCWESMNSTDKAKSADFYTKVMGWTHKDEGMGVFNAGSTMVADLGSAPPGMPSHWLLHVVVDKLETARAHAERLGGKVLMGEIPIPGVGRMAVVADPTGAAISLFESAPPPAAS